MPADVTVRLARGAAEEDYGAANRAADEIAQALAASDKHWTVSITQPDDSGDWNIALILASDNQPMWGLGFAGPRDARPRALVSVTLDALRMYKVIPGDPRSLPALDAPVEPIDPDEFNAVVTRVQERATSGNTRPQGLTLSVGGETRHYKLSDQPLNNFAMHLKEVLNQDAARFSCFIRRWMAYLDLMDDDRAWRWMRLVRDDEADAEVHPALIEAVATHPLTQMEFEPVSFFARVEEIAATKYPDEPCPNTKRPKPKKKSPSKRRRMRM